MKKQKRIVIIFLLMLFIIFLTTQTVFATSKYQVVEFTDEFKEWLKLDDSEKQKILAPSMYNVPSKMSTYQNPFYQARLLRSSLTSTYNLKTVIPANLKIKNQMQTGSCWAFASLSSLETTLALSDKNNGKDTSKVYDYSERHMDYASSDVFSDSQTNPLGYNRQVGDGGNWIHAESYLINGNGAVLESDMPFENNEDIIPFSEVTGKNIATQVYDTVNFADYNKLSGTERTEVINQVKQHIQNYGAVFAPFHGAQSDSSSYSCYNSETAAKYCNNSLLHPTDHAVSIVGWIDDYEISNFVEEAQPTEKGAWIIRNSWGERLEYNLAELRQQIFDAYEEQCIARGWTEPSKIPDDFITQIGLTIEGDIAYEVVGDNGFMYVSYEDCNISSLLRGFTKVEAKTNYDHIYQYDIFTPAYQITNNTSTIILRNVFTKKTSSTEYLNRSGIPISKYLYL